MLGAKIKQYLDDNGISQTFVAVKSGIKIQCLNASLKNKRKILAEEYFAICKAFKQEKARKDGNPSEQLQKTSNSILTMKGGSVNAHMFKLWKVHKIHKTCWGKTNSS